MRSWARPNGRTLAFFALTWLLGGLYAIATPVMGVPDEPAHVIRAASVVRGQLTPGSRPDDVRRYDTARVPETLAFPLVPCFTLDGLRGAPSLLGAAGASSWEVASPASRYNPLYYAVEGLPTLIRPGEGTVYVMRWLTAAIAAALLTLAFIALRELRAPRWGLAALAAAVTPTVLFFAGSVNPSGVEIAAAVALWATLLVWFTVPRPELERSRAVRAGIAAVALVTTRSFGPLFLVLVVSGALLVAPDARSVLRRAPFASRPGSLRLRRSPPSAGR